MLSRLVFSFKLKTAYLDTRIKIKVDTLKKLFKCLQKKCKIAFYFTL